MRTLIAAAAILAAGLATTAARSAGPQIPATFGNLQVLPKDIPRANLVEIMKQFCFDLDVRCQHCHVGEGDDLSVFDFASDARPAKATARAMMRMLVAINTEHLRGVGEASATPKVTCYTCHRGATRPLAAAPKGGGLPPDGDS